MPLETIEVEAGPGTGTTPVAGSIIWLHGLGADGHDFEAIVPELTLEAPLRFIFPHAPEREVTINGGMEMRAWYDIDPGSPLSGSDDIAQSVNAIDDLVAAEIERGVPSEQIVLAGFSQGGVIALELALTSTRTFAGVMALSTYVHDHERLADRVSFSSVDLPILMAHGMADPMIPIARAITAREALRQLNYQIEWFEYGMGHQVCLEEINDISRWLSARF